MRDTPRTDIMITGNCTPSPDEYEELAAFTRKLERDNNKLMGALEHVQEAIENSLSQSSWVHEGKRKQYAKCNIDRSLILDAILA